MKRLDQAISEVAYILDALRAYREICDTGNCNECDIKNVCKICPAVGQVVRYNCPFFVREDARNDG